jgi:hypothetical protein
MKKNKKKTPKSVEEGGASDDDDDEADWVDEEEENMSDRDEVIRRTWQWKTLEVKFQDEHEDQPHLTEVSSILIHAYWLNLQFLTGIPCLTFVVTVVFVDLIVAICTFALDPSPSENRDVEIFGFVNC